MLVAGVTRLCPVSGSGPGRALVSHQPGPFPIERNMAEGWRVRNESGPRCGQKDRDVTEFYEAQAQLSPNDRKAALGIEATLNHMSDQRSNGRPTCRNHRAPTESAGRRRGIVVDVGAVIARMIARAARRQKDVCGLVLRGINDIAGKSWT